MGMLGSEKRLTCQVTGQSRIISGFAFSPFRLFVFSPFRLHGVYVRRLMGCLLRSAVCRNTLYLPTRTYGNGPKWSTFRLTRLQGSVCAYDWSVLKGKDPPIILLQHPRIFPAVAGNRDRPNCDHEREVQGSTTWADGSVTFPFYARTVCLPFFFSQKWEM